MDHQRRREWATGEFQWPRDPMDLLWHKIRGENLIVLHLARQRVQFGEKSYQLRGHAINEYHSIGPCHARRPSSMIWEFPLGARLAP
ncbi:hypothetical protein EVAR_101965_1 [Eumeta japonica]|uniref:Uncharacterized protein n=1 Tax=Eumeta variegata TaxID=151549 RepID=A0A4C1TSG2_EUMVA|nr:hypothetical protein EVAR_101965_1 [Eumeta japonica]